MEQRQTTIPNTRNNPPPRAAEAHVPSTAPTPGPWFTPTEVAGLTVWSGNGEVQICRCDSRQLSIAGNYANARLISAAPDLLEALQELLAAVDGVPCGPEAKCRAAIAKAAHVRYGSAA